MSLDVYAKARGVEYLVRHTKREDRRLSGVNNVEHAPLWAFLEKDILPEEIQTSFGTS
jgi:hypothetical protein